MYLPGGISEQLLCAGAGRWQKAGHIHHYSLLGKGPLSVKQLRFGRPSRVKKIGFLVTTPGSSTIIAASCGLSSYFTLLYDKVEVVVQIMSASSTPNITSACKSTSELHEIVKSSHRQITRHNQPILEGIVCFSLFLFF